MRRTDMSSRGALGRSGPSHQLSQPRGHGRTNPGRSHPEAYRQQSTSRGGFRCVLWSTRWHALEGENRKDPRDSRPSRHRVVRHQPERSPRGWRKVRPESEKTKRGGGRPAQRSSDEFPSPFWPSELSPSLPSIGFLMTRFWTIGAGALVGPGGDIGPRAWTLRAGAPATTAPPLGGR